MLLKCLTIFVSEGPCRIGTESQVLVEKSKPSPARYEVFLGHAEELIDNIDKVTRGRGMYLCIK